MKASEILKAKDWCQGSMARGPYPFFHSMAPENPQAVAFCISGAIFLATLDNYELRQQLRRFVWLRIMKLGGYACAGIEDWNDQPSRKKEEVIEVMEAAEADMENLPVTFSGQEAGVKE